MNAENMEIVVDATSNGSSNGAVPPGEAPEAAPQTAADRLRADAEKLKETARQLSEALLMVENPQYPKMHSLRLVSLKLVDIARQYAAAPDEEFIAQHAAKRDHTLEEWADRFETLRADIQTQPGFTWQLAKTLHPKREQLKSEFVDFRSHSSGEKDEHASAHAKKIIALVNRITSDVSNLRISNEEYKAEAAESSKAPLNGHHNGNR
ncbi:MAG: hypothetical protein KGJ06_05415, partial [Pseudomonadota bacterium]|nr:hypothetical protein [Pseudomonadota bacterium]